MDVAEQLLDAAIQTLQSHKGWADRAIAQLPDAKLHEPLDENTNSIVVIMKHVAGNLLSRWTDFLTADGEKPWRNRDDEFVDDFTDRAALLAYWEKGWACLFDSLGQLQSEDLAKTVFIRGEPHTVVLALQRSLGHTCYHVGQIIQLARHHAGDNWTTLTIARGQSEQFNREHWGDGRPASP